MTATAADAQAVASARRAARTAAAIAEQAGALLLRHFRDDSLSSRWKEDFSIVTEADLEADRLITARLAEAFPGDAVLSEELVTVFSPTSSHVWIVDPLDGTTNFSLGAQHWGVSIARCDAAGPDVGVLFFPALGELYVASRGGGAVLNGKPVHVRSPSSARPVGMIACCARTPRWHHVNLPMKIRVYGSAAWTLACVARGTAAIGIETTPKVWDLAAGWCLVEEAGGFIETIDGSHPFPLVPERDYAAAGFPVRAAASRDLMAQARESIEPRR